MIVALAYAGSTHIDASVTVQVDDREAAIAAVIAVAEGTGGWFSNLSDDAVVVRVPTAEAAAVLDRGKELGLVVDRQWSVQDLDAERVDLGARLASRQAVLERYMGILAGTDAAAIVAVEREITRTVAEIEQIQGRLRVLDDRAAFARLGFSFRFRDRAAPARDGTSSFAWLNTLNLADLQDAFRSGRHAHRSCGIRIDAPEGFAAGRKQSRFVALSPDDVLLRARSVRNKPRADLGFWREAMRGRMEAAGYRVVAEGSVGGGALLELAAPDGEADAAYLVAVFVDGGRLVLVEASGEVSHFAARRDAIVAAIEAMGY